MVSWLTSLRKVHYLTSEGEPGSVFGLFQGRVYHHPKGAVVRCFVMSSHEQFKDDRFHIFPILNEEQRVATKVRVVRTSQERNHHSLHIFCT